MVINCEGILTVWNARNKFPYTKKVSMQGEFSFLTLQWLSITDLLCKMSEVQLFTRKSILKHSSEQN